MLRSLTIKVGSGERAQRVEALPDNLTSIPEACVKVAGENQFYKVILCSSCLSPTLPTLILIMNEIFKN